MNDPTTAPPVRPAPQRAPAGVPRLPRTYVPRLALWSRLDAAAGAAVTTLVAPAGAGKTLGVAGWLREARADADLQEVVWLDGHRGLDAARLDAVLESAAPGGGHGSRPGLVVIDDAHALPVSAVRLLDARLDDAPQRLRVLLLSRWDLPLTRLAPQLLGHLTELRGDVLRLSDDETARLVEQHVGTTVPEVVATIATRAEGWCAVVVLTSRLVAASPDPAAAVRRISHRSSEVADQVASEVFATLTPRERHLLLCTASEHEVSPGTAAHLTNDRGAGLVLDGLESTGLLVTRSEPGPAEDAPADGPRRTREARFRIHPLLAEVVRRRVAAGGVDVERARATVLRAVRLDVGRGDTVAAFGRLVDLGLAEAAAERLVEDGTRLLMRGHDKDVVAFAQRWPDELEGRPESWFVLGVERWVHGDVQSAMHWFDRLFRSVGGAAVPSHRLSAQHLCARLMRARAGFEPLDAVARLAQEHVDSPSFSSTPADLQPHVLGELGIVQLTLGMLVPAETNLLRAARLGDELGLPAHAAAALTHLAGLYYMRGREHVAGRLAARSLESMQHLGAGLGVPRHRALLYSRLASMSTLPMSLPLPLPPAEPSGADRVDDVVHPADATTRFWQQVHDARVQLSEGSVIQAERTLQAVIDVPGLPCHLRATLLIERGYLAALCDDRTTLRTLTAELHEHGHLGEALLLRGVAADLGGDLRLAVDQFAAAADHAVLDQPPCRALALVGRAQLLDALGDAHGARVAVLAAVRATESRANYVAFLGWSRHGTGVHALLRRFGNARTDPWLGQLVELTGQHPDITSALAASTPTTRERHTPEPLVTTHLSPRERDVLRELARGATYADIATGLFVSENTVKTHVSSLYSKLGASRRSEALSVARRLELL
ncbi:LuxR C-terminal-related transcriptional regulator [Nocardioides renjunii]|uniref:LuxR C-terminal-related transcriptional regulator n=1 Tax=Nocardioides renjunii TaxID=3095075 RepID=UPI002AFFFDF9|nr:LuxR C-terminal-related transcriptional regulator [Nocardioides sp. S-34]WQQ24287.1 LuxR C-terminal-related transcriptional regulator [Nocardioides sp. S-34]